MPMTTELPLSVMCGQLIVGGFVGTAPSSTFREALRRGERGGAILFRRNLLGTLQDVASLCRELAAATPADLPPSIAIDQEGGRVTRLGPPMLKLPPMRAFGVRGDEDLVHRAASLLGAQLAALGFTMDFAPVLDVDTCSVNPIIGDRSFSSEATRVMQLGAAYASGLQAGGVLACGKHFPGHGDTTVDSHLDLPVVDQPLSRLSAVELVPFRSLRASTCAAFMTAHVVYPALDPHEPATLSRRIAHDLLREELGYDGLLVSDDLEMKAVADRMPIEESAVKAIRAGCDVLLVCSNEELQDRAHAALVQEAERDPSFRHRAEQAAQRGLMARRARPPAPLEASAIRELTEGSRAETMRLELESRGVFA